MIEPRCLTIEEFEHCTEALNRANGNGIEQARNDLIGAYVAVFDNYITNGPGYHGKIVTIAWAGGPDIPATVICWNNAGEAYVA